MNGHVRSYVVLALGVISVVLSVGGIVATLHGRDLPAPYWVVLASAVSALAPLAIPPKP